MVSIWEQLIPPVLCTLLLKELARKLYLTYVILDDDHTNPSFLHFKGLYPDSNHDCGRQP